MLKGESERDLPACRTGSCPKGSWPAANRSSFVNLRFSTSDNVWSVKTSDLLAGTRLTLPDRLNSGSGEEAASD